MTASTTQQLVFLTGLTKDTKTGEYVTFSSHLDIGHSHWIDIPAALIDTVDILGTETVDGDTYSRVRLRLHPPQSQEGRVLHAIVIIQENALRQAQERIILPALAAEGDPKRANAACLACLDACRQATYAEDDLLGPIRCMLNCSACPG